MDMKDISPACFGTNLPSSGSTDGAYYRL